MTMNDTPEPGPTRTRAPDAQRAGQGDAQRAGQGDAIPLHRLIRGAWVQPASRKFVLLALSFYADRETGGNAFPALATLARDTSMSDKQVRRHLQALESDGLIRATASARRGRGATYQINLQKLADSAAAVALPPVSGKPAPLPSHGRSVALPPASHCPPIHVPLPSHPRETT